MAGTNVITYQDHHTVKKIICTWLSDASGDVDTTLTKNISGVIERIVNVPDQGDDTPTTLYDVTLLDAEGVDVSQAVSINLVVTGPTQQFPTVRPAVDGPLQLVVANAGDSKIGVTHVYYR